MKQYLMRLLAVILIALCLLGISNISVNAAMTKIEMIFTNPGEDSSTQMNISFHAPGEDAKVLYTIATDTAFANALTVEAKGVRNNDYKDNSSANIGLYTFDVCLSDLIPNTNYIYKVKYSVKESQVYTFKTAGIDGEFNFAIVGDIHASAVDSSYKEALNVGIGYVKVAEELTKDIGGIDFVLSQGDLTRYGERYSDWEQWNDSYINKNYMFATCPGNKEYYNLSHAVSSNKWFKAALNNPDNGAQALKTTYWFKYNSVLFISLDNIYPSFDADSIANSVKDWMRYVVKKNEGTYQYLIVYKHYPCFTSSNSKDYSSCDYGNYPLWYKLYDELNVDIVFSGDSHEYVRSKRLYNNEPYEGDDKGTIYITLPMTATSKGGRSNYMAASNCLLEVIAKDGASYGGEYVQVTKEGLKYVMFDDGKNIKDTFEIKPKREYNYSSSIDLMKDSINVFLNTAKTKGIAYFNPGYAGLVNEVKVSLNGNTLNTYSNGENQFDFNSLANNDKISLEFTFVDGSKYEYTYTVNTNNEYGEIYGFNANVNNGQLVLSFNSDLKNNVVNKFEVYKGTKLLTTLKPTDKSYTTSLNDVSNEGYTLKAIDSNGNVVFSDTYFYNVIGDTNYDGLVNTEDLVNLTNQIVNKTSDLNNHDCNYDGIIDIEDLTIINQLRNKQNVNASIKVKVKFVDINGNTIDYKVIDKGSDVTAPSLKTVAGYSFAGWDKSTKAIMQDTTIKAVYNIADN